MAAGNDAMITSGDARATAAGALQRGDLGGATLGLRSYLAENADPEARLDLARVLQMTREFDAARAQLEAAFREFTQAGDLKRAAVAASRLGEFYLSGLGNRVAARPWLARAWRLIEQEEPCVERGWVAITDVGCNVNDPEELRQRAQIALEMACRFGDTDLEIKALADSGLAMVETGEVTAGMARLEEALALITAGVARDGWVAGQSVCSFFSACWCAGDLGRLEAWCEMLRERGLIGEQGVPPLNVHCDSVYGTLLCTLGRWTEAETVLTRCVQSSETVAAAIRVRALCAMAELRMRQGRLDEAEQLLLGHDDHIEALIAMARLHLARGDRELAAGAARRGLRLLGRDQLRAAQLLVVLVDAELGRGDQDAAAQAAVQLAECAVPSGVPALTAEAALAHARIHAARGETDEAISELDRALTGLGDADLPLLRAQLHLELARLHAPRQRGAAVAEARAVAAIHARLGIPLADDGARVLRELGVGLSGVADRQPGEPAGSTRAVLAASVGGWSTIRCGTATFKLRDTKGLGYLAELIAHPGVERHALDLVELADPADPDGRAVRHQLSDAGPLIDAQAKVAYRRRIETLREQVDEAQALGDDDRAILLQQEIDEIVRELARALGLGGRDRRTASGAERARLNVTRAIRAAIARIEHADQRAGRALDRDTRTGMFCSYHPTPTSDVIWTVGTARILD
jgi:tetratricopeptide (TPR) repeat protein